MSGTDGRYVNGDADGRPGGPAPGRRPPATLGDGWGVEPPQRWGRLHRGDVAGEPVETLRGRWDTYYPAFADAVRGHGPVPVDPQDAVATATVLDAARESATTGRTVVLRADRDPGTFG